jgi:hypothetical protein
MLHVVASSIHWFGQWEAPGLAVASFGLQQPVALLPVLPPACFIALALHRKHDHEETYSNSQ